VTKPKPADKPYTFMLTVKGGPNRFSVMYDGVLAANTDREAAKFVSSFRRLLSESQALPKSKPGPGEVTIRKDGSRSNG
jgi:hypothetical protein